MKREKRSPFPLLLTVILYTFGFLLLLEWLYPFADSIDENGITVFILFACICFIVYLLRVNIILKLLLNVTLLFCFLHWFYIQESFLSEAWFRYVWREVLFNSEIMITGLWHEITPLFWATLLFTLILLMGYLIYHWFVETKRIFLFIFITILYLSILDTFSDYDARVAIVRTFIVSFAALALANLLKVLKKESIPFAWNKNIRLTWLLPITAIILLSTLFGYTAPKMEPKWPDPVPFVQDVAGDAMIASQDVQKVGYGSNDENLGGSFVQDDTPVFRATVESRHYWRGETKDLYTGKGWENSADPELEQQVDGDISLQTFSNVKTTKREGYVELHPESASNNVFYPYGVTEIEVEGQVQLMLDRQKEAITAQIGDKQVNVDEYSVVYQQPSYSMDQLNQVEHEDPEHIKGRYTQLPDNLPERIGALAEEITASFETRYEKAKAIQNYFHSNGFVYRTTDIPVPGENEDYVDQFLFESRVGYCDNFSTSMVILLRTLDIPARWVKGFTSGELVERENGYQTYEITNANAHSWVEVYFPEVGWVPFEPTQGFSDLSDLYVEQEWSEEEQEEFQQSEWETPEEEQEEEEAPAAERNTDSSRNMTINWEQVVLLGLILLGIGLVLYLSRFRLLTMWHRRRLTEQLNAKNIQEAYHFLLKMLEKKGFKKTPDQTLREFSKIVDQHYDTDGMARLTTYYEQILYKNKQKNDPTNEVLHLWEQLIHKIAG